MTVGSMFSGLGGLDRGFESEGFEVIWMVERDPFCREALAKHWPGVPVYTDARMSVAQWRQVPRPDVIIGGFPCQDVSNAGARAGLSGDRSGLWWCIRRAVRILGPRYVCIENVPGLFARGFDVVLRSLARVGCDAEWQVVRASDVGAPQLRARVFIVAYPDSRRREGCGQSESGGERGSRGGEPDGCGAVRELNDTTLVAWRGWPARPGEPQHAWEPPRVLASARAQSKVGALPDGVPIDLPGWRRAALQAIGNAVVPQVGAVVARRVRELAHGAAR